MEHDSPRLISTPVSVADGFKRADGKTWKTLLIAAAIAVVLVLVLNMFIEKKPLRWPTTSPQTPVQKSEPRTYDVAPPKSVPGSQ